MQPTHHTLNRNLHVRQSDPRIFYFRHRFCQRIGAFIRGMRLGNTGRRCVRLSLIFFLLSAVPLIANAASITLAWDPNNPPPLEYQIFLRQAGQKYDYSSPAWHGTATQCTLNNLGDGQTYYAVARAYSGSANNSADSNEVQFVTPVASQNQTPVAQAGSDQAVSIGTKVVLDGTGSQDPDGSISAYQWTQIGGQTVSLQGAGTAQASFYAPDVTSNTILTFQIQVTDQQGLSAVDTCNVTVVPDAQSSGSSNTDSQAGNVSGGGTGSLVIVDNRDAAFSSVGTWKTSKWSAGYYGADYAYANAGNGSAEATFTFQIPTTGNYEIAARWTAHSSRASDAPYIIINNGVVVDTIFIDQRIDGGQFNLLTGPASQGAGIYTLNAGVLEIIVSNDANGNVIADAVQVADMGSYDTPATGSTVDNQTGNDGGGVSSHLLTIVDNRDAAFSKTAGWKSSKWSDGFFGTNYVYAKAGYGSAKATFSFQVPTSGNYEIAAQWTSHSSRAPDAPFTLVNNGVVVDTVFVDQRFDGGQFNPLTGAASSGNGVYWLEAGTLEVILSNDAAGNVVADAARIER